MANTVPVYSQLARSCFRLLRLPSIAWHEHTDVSLEMQCFPLDNHPKYNALSYCWGTKPRSQPIVCNGGNLLITPTLTATLKALAATEQSSEIAWIWIDQICINQDDLDERAQQVSLMRDIYRNAERTLIYLGRELPGLATATGILDRFWRLSRDYRTDGADSSGSQAVTITIQQYESAGLPDETDPVWETLEELLLRPWFGRAWIIQEVALSSRPPRLLCGAVELSWEKLVEAAVWLSAACYDYTPLSMSDSADLIWRAISSIVLHHELRQRQHRLWELRALLEYTGSSSSTDPRDKVYSLLGLAAEAAAADVAMPAALVVSYSKSIRDVFRDVTRYIIESSRDLTILYHIRYTADWEAYPSWVVDFARHHNRGALFAMAWEPSEAIGLTRKVAYHNACRGLPAVIEPSDDVDALRVRGFTLGAVEVVGAFPRGFEGLKNADPVVLHIWKSVHRHLAHRHASLDALAHAFMVTMKADMPEGATWPSSQSTVNFWAYLAKAYEQMLLSTTVEGDRQKCEQTFAHLIDWDGAKAGDADAFVVPTDSTPANKMFLAGDGRALLGLGPPVMEDGDVACIFLGGPMPVILRPIGERYRYVGECYVYGVMEGQAVEGENGGSHVMRSFTLE